MQLESLVLNWVPCLYRVLRKVLESKKEQVEESLTERTVVGQVPSLKKEKDLVHSHLDSMKALGDRSPCIAIDMFPRHNSTPRLSNHRDILGF
jgi:hypothetical protein